MLGDKPGLLNASENKEMELPLMNCYAATESGVLKE